MEWQRIGLKPPPCVLAATEEYFESQDAIKRWIEEECIQSERATVTTAELYQSWKIWAEKQGEYVGSVKKFAEDIINRGFQKWRSGQNRGVRGLMLRGSDVDEEML
jgi:putative DNA primase/helicase